ncbi:MAG: UDP-N-acetylmuramate--L-alanine ligase [Clostridia bacterium]|jgi:UDP-N-acetylmuramate--alanine ligase|nr:UDP-N-acetylmuramate--L-alanine ligase [Clostridia bacterium]
MKLDFNKYKNIYFIGIGGVSMSGLAEILYIKGLNVSGSDMKESDATKKLVSSGITVHIGHSAKNITDDINLVVYTAAIKSSNPEIIAAKEKGILTVERAVLLGNIMDWYEKSIAVAGTHGKTTTSSMIAEIMIAAKKDPTITIGGNLSTIGGNIKIGKSEYFVAEACEYHDSFLKFYPFTAVILNVEAEHLDYFKDITNIRTSFHKFALNVPECGYVIIKSTDPGKSTITANLKCNVITFGMDGSNSMWYPLNISMDDSGRASFDACFCGIPKLHVNLKVPGKHNILNALAACAAATTVGVSPEKIAEGLENYTGVDRRFQYKGTFNGITVVDDYAHHPTEVRATLAAAKNVKHNTIWCLFQPHTYSRAKTLLADFGKAFKDADKVLLADIYAAREKDTGIISSKDVAEEIRKNGTDALYLGDFESIKQYVLDNAKPGDLVITMGAGDIYKVGDMLLTK